MDTNLTDDRTDDSEAPRPPSKSQMKRDMEALQNLGTQLVQLSAQRLARIEMPETLRKAVLDAQRITQNGAIRRQRQYIGKLMRSVDIAPIQSALDEIKGQSAAANARQHKLERLRTQLMQNEDVLGEIAREYPHADLQHLRQLRRNALKEEQQNKPPRAYREIFRILRELGQHETPHEEQADEHE